jgi:hypothetical protein
MVDLEAIPPPPSMVRLRGLPGSRHLGRPYLWVSGSGHALRASRGNLSGRVLTLNVVVVVKGVVDVFTTGGALSTWTSVGRRPLVARVVVARLVVSRQIATVPAQARPSNGRTSTLPRQALEPPRRD